MRSVVVSGISVEVCVGSSSSPPSEALLTVELEEEELLCRLDVLEEVVDVVKTVVGKSVGISREMEVWVTISLLSSGESQNTPPRMSIAHEAEAGETRNERNVRESRR